MSTDSKVDRYFHELLREAGLKLRGNIILKSGDPVGILVPGLIFGHSPTGNLHIVGPKGRIACNSQPDQLIVSLIASGGILFGKPEEIYEVDRYLTTAETSRTTSYLSCLCNGCDELLSAHKRLASALVVVLGCGGIGSVSGLLLAGAGLGALRFVDQDLIEKSNLNRQLLYTLADVGLAKVTVAAQAVLLRYPTTKVEAVREFVTNDKIEQLCRGASAILMTADDPLDLVSDVSKYAEHAKIPFIVAGYTADQGLVTSNWKHDSLGDGLTWFRGPNSIMPSFGPTNAELAGMASTLAVQIIGGIVLGNNAKQTYRYSHRFPRQFLPPNAVEG